MGTYECMLLYNGIAWLGIQIEYELGEGEGDCFKVDLVNYFLDFQMESTSQVYIKS